MSKYCIHNGTLLTGYAELPNSAIYIVDGYIEDIFSEARFNKKKFDSDVKIIDAKSSYISPGFQDNHIHGFYGYGVDDYSIDSILQMSKYLAKYGVTGFCPTLYPDDEDKMLKGIEVCRDAMGQEEGAKILGIHLEGPFISRNQLGVQRAEVLKDVSLELMEKFWKTSNGKITNMTVAPELKNMRDIALYCSKKNITLQAGHTDATYENMIEGMQSGILHSTHFFNAMSKLHHRNPNAVGAILIHPEMACEIIADGFHVHPGLINLLLRDKPISKVVLITDALKPTAQKEGKLFANNEEVYFDGNIFKRKKDDVIAGSSLTMIKGIENLVSWGVHIENAVKMASSNPARILGIEKKGVLRPGYFADITIFNKDFNIELVMVEGNIKYSK